MLNPITFTIEDRESGSLVTIQASGLDYAAYEDTFDKPVITAIIDGRYKAMTWLCWHAMQRAGKTEQTYDEFLAGSPQFGAPEKVEDVVPLETSQPTGS